MYERIHASFTTDSRRRSLTACVSAAARWLVCRFAQMSCSNWRWGYFSVYNMTSRVQDLDFLVALGDWIYEYENTTYPAANQGKRRRY
jgi:phosphodiesterase/alkaline phosphatase D-like protein